MLKVHKHTFWMLGVIAGLAIRESLTKVVTPLLGDANTQVAHNDMAMEAVRLVVFLAMILRFYLGSAQYFDVVYCSPESDSTYPKKSYGMDFIFAVMLFILFFAWSETIIGNRRFSNGLSSFLLILGLILVYDLIWWAISWRYSTKLVIGAWALLNVGTMILCYLLLLVFNVNGWFGVRMDEVICLFPLALTTLADFGEMFTDRNFLTDSIVRVLQKSRVT